MEAIMKKDYYLVLGISRGADLNKIKKAYRTIVKNTILMYRMKMRR
jgi:curved DNA-binding protein CbpA